MNFVGLKDHRGTSGKNFTIISRPSPFLLHEMPTGILISGLPMMFKLDSGVGLQYHDGPPQRCFYHHLLVGFCRLLPRLEVSHHCLHHFSAGDHSDQRIRRGCGICSKGPTANRLAHDRSSTKPSQESDVKAFNMEDYENRRFAEEKSGCFKPS